VATNIFEKHAAYTISINGSSVRVQSADMGRGKVVRDVCRVETEHNPDQELQWTDTMRNYTAAMALFKATMYHHMTSINNGKRRPHWMESGNEVQRLGSIFLENCGYMTAQYHSPQYESIGHYAALKWKQYNLLYFYLNDQKLRYKKISEIFLLFFFFLLLLPLLINIIQQILMSWYQILDCVDIC